MASWLHDSVNRWLHYQSIDSLLPVLLAICLSNVPILYHLSDIPFHFRTPSESTSLSLFPRADLHIHNMVQKSLKDVLLIGSTGQLAPVLIRHLACSPQLTLTVLTRSQTTCLQCDVRYVSLQTPYKADELAGLLKGKDVVINLIPPGQLETYVSGEVHSHQASTPIAKVFYTTAHFGQLVDRS